MNRRGFLKLTTAAASALAVPVGLIAYKEPIIRSGLKPWVAEKDGWYEVLVPAGKTLSKETFDKPILLILQDGARFTDNIVRGFVNCHTSGEGFIERCVLESRAMVSVTNKDRPVLTARGDNITLRGCTLRRVNDYQWPMADGILTSKARLIQNTFLS